MAPNRWRLLLWLLVAVGSEGFAQDGSRDAEGPADEAVRQRVEFVAAFERARAGRQAMRPDSDALQEYVLYPYLQAARLAQGVASASAGWTQSDEEVDGFLNYYAGEPVTWPLRYTWLETLARRQLWQPYLDHYSAEVADAQLRCLYLTARIERGVHAGLAPLIVAQYLTPRQLPIECERVFQWLRERGPLDDDVIERRVRLLLESRQTSFARVIAGRLPEARAVPLERVADLLENPAAGFDALIAAPDEDIDPETLLDAWAYFARNAPGAALDRYEGLMAALGHEPQASSPYALALALGLAWDRRPEALDLFDRVATTDLDDYAREWQARAALWAGDWPRARASIAAMSAELRATTQWRYWAARSSRDRDERKRLYASTLGDDNYYSAMAAAQLREDIEPHPLALPLDASGVAAIATTAAFVRSAELREVGLPVAAAREWRHGYAALDGASKRQAVHLAMAWQWFDLGVATATQHQIFNDYALLYPTPYRAAVDAAVSATGLEPELVYAVIRQESLYRADAVSAAGARGLMQLRPGTAAGVRARAGEGIAERSNLLDPAVNVNLGSAELARLLERYDGQIVVALAAYNAGPAAVDRWLPTEQMDADIWVENIPYNETREYVRRVLWHRVVFHWLETGRALDTRDWRESVTPR